MIGMPHPPSGAPAKKAASRRLPGRARRRLPPVLGAAIVVALIAALAAAAVVAGGGSRAVLDTAIASGASGSGPLGAEERQPLPLATLPAFGDGDPVPLERYRGANHSW